MVKIILEIPTKYFENFEKFGLKIIPQGKDLEFSRYFKKISKGFMKYVLSVMMKTYYSNEE